MLSNGRTDDTLFCHDGPYSFCMPLLPWHDEADLQSDWCIDTRQSHWNLCDTLRFIEYTCTQVILAFSHSFSFSFLYSSFVNCHIWTTKNVVAIIRVAIATKIFWMPFFGIHFFDLMFHIWKKNLPMPTCPAFSSDGVPGPLAGRESAPSVALFMHYVQFNFVTSKIEYTKENRKKRKKIERKNKKERKKKNEKNIVLVAFFVSSLKIFYGFIKRKREFTTFKYEINPKILTKK